MRHLFIINPVSGKKGSTQRIERLLENLTVPHEVVYTTCPGEAKRITQEAASLGEPTRIYACGGDGTLNEVVNGAAGQPHIAVTNVPKGTGNDFIRIFGADARAQFSNLEALARGEERAFDLIDCNGTYGLDVVCAGVDARVGVDVHRYKQLPLVNGKWAYLISLFVNVVFKGISRHMLVEVEGRQWEGETTLLCVCNGRYYGGGFMPVPEAVPDDGILDMLLVPKLSLFTLGRVLKPYAAGEYKQLGNLVQDFHGDGVTISSHRPITVSVDGEKMEDTTFVIRKSEKKVNFFYPTGLSY